jgi:hypothetical protein
VHSHAELFHDAVPQVRDAGRFDHPDLLQLEVGADALEQARAPTEQERHDVQLRLVDVPGRQVLVDDVGAAPDQDVLLAGGGAGLLERRLDPVGDEGERGVGERQGLALVVGQDEHGHVERRVLSPPSRPRVLAPRARPAAELPTAYDLGADVRLGLLDHGVAGVHLAALQPVRGAPGAQRDNPVVQALARFAERVLLALIRPRDIAVRRDRDVAPEPAHLQL